MPSRKLAETWMTLNKQTDVKRSAFAHTFEFHVFFSAFAVLIL